MKLQSFFFDQTGCFVGRQLGSHLSSDLCHLTSVPYLLASDICALASGLSQP